MIFLASWLAVQVNGQINKRLLNSAITPGVAMYRQPLQTLWLKKDELWGYKINIQEFKENVDTTVILEIIANSQQMDTSQWTYREVPKVILVNSEKDQIPQTKLKTFLKNVRPSPISDLNIYNNLPPEKRNILSYSRPVYDKSKRYAAVAYRENGGYGTVLYHLINNRWVKLGSLEKWVY